MKKLLLIALVSLLQQLPIHAAEAAALAALNDTKKPFKCKEPECGAAFTTLGNLKKHHNKHNTEQTQEAALSLLLLATNGSNSCSNDI